MARTNRVQLAGARYHVGSRGIRKAPIFLADHEREFFLTLLADIVRRFGWVCEAYCLMSNHYHLAIRTPEPNIGDGMHRLNGLYAQAFNRWNGFKGHLFEERYWSAIVATEEHVINLMRYLMLNPVRAGLCTLPHEWRWSSYRATVGLDAKPPFLNTDWVEHAFGAGRGGAGFRASVLDGLERGVAAPPPYDRHNDGTPM
ncbi:MAG TPA: transposase [Gaiellales bacterium]|nr:transposase [Gaiellales bacterium]